MQQTHRRPTRRIRIRPLHAFIFGFAVAVILCGLITAAGGASDATDTKDTLYIAAAQGNYDSGNYKEPEITNLLYTESKETTWQEAAQPEIEMLAKLLWGEADVVKSTTQKAAVIWCVLNRVDAENEYGCPDTIAEVITFPGQFSGWDEDHPATEEYKKLAEDIIGRWLAEKNGAKNVGRVLPVDYLWFTGDGKVNTFTNEWRGGDVWDWSLPSPYEN